MSSARKEKKMRNLVKDFENAIWNLSAEHECGWNEDNCRPGLEQAIEDAREAIVEYAMQDIHR